MITPDPVLFVFLSLMGYFSKRLAMRVSQWPSVSFQRGSKCSFRHCAIMGFVLPQNDTISSMGKDM
jgi:hypothetical protein